jgi:hypothetical protein
MDKMKLGGGGRYERLIGSLEKKGVKDPAALAASQAIKARILVPTRLSFPRFLASGFIHLEDFRWSVVPGHGSKSSLDDD